MRTLKGFEPPAGARIRKKNEKSKIRGGGVICAPSQKDGIVPKYVANSVNAGKIR